jgi:DNA polymerase-1
MIEAFKRGEDIHARTAAEIFGVAPDKVTKEMRRQAKVMNFGIIYGMGAGGFARASGVDNLRAREFITRYFDEFKSVARFMEGIKNKAHKDGYVETIFGRRRKLLDIHSTMPQIQAGAERAAINHPVQGTAADLMKLAMIKVHEFVHSKYGRDDVRLLLQVHDELVCEIKTDLVKEISREVKKIMESVHKLAVPLIVDAKNGENWQEVETVPADVSTR